MTLPPWRILLACALPFFSGGCMHALLTHAIVEAPNLRQTPEILQADHQTEKVKIDATYAAAWRLPVGPPAAELSVAVIAPGDYGMIHSIQQKPRAAGGFSMFPVTTWNAPQPRPDPRKPAKATILILHGYTDTKESMIHWALYLAQAGYRCVLVDLRGHGRSTGEVISYGAFEVSDLQRVLDDLAHRHLLTGPVGLLGLSYGASIGLELAAADPRIGAVVALEPFSDSQKGVVEFAKGVIPDYVKGWTDLDFQTALATAATQAHFHWTNDDVYAAVAARPVPTLYFHATNDPWIPVEETKRLFAHTAGPRRAGYLTYPSGNGHVLLSWTLEPLAANATDWFETALLHPGPDLAARLEHVGPKQGSYPAGH